MKRLISTIFVLICFAVSGFAQPGPDKDSLFVHLKTGLKHDDAQICVAYNVIWAALKSGMAVDVLVDADAINTFKTGTFSSSDSIEEYKIPDNLREAISRQFDIQMSEVPQTYGDYLKTLAKEGAQFYINKGFLIVSKIAPNPDKNMGKIAPYAAELFKPVSLKEMIQLRKKSLFDYTF